MKKVLSILAILAISVSTFASAPAEGRFNASVGASVMASGSNHPEKNLWSVGVSYDQEIQESLSYVVGANYMQHSYDFSTYVVEAGLAYEIVEDFYTVVAVNYNFFSAETLDFDSRLGYRIGFGYDVTEDISTELSFEQLNNQVNSPFGGVHIKTDTVKVAAIYHF